MTGPARRAHLEAVVSLDEQYGETFAPTQHIDQAGRHIKAMVDVVDGLWLTAQDPAMLHRLAAALIAAAADLKAALAAKSGGAS